MLAVSLYSTGSGFNWTILIFYFALWFVFSTGWAIACGVIAKKHGKEAWLYALMGFFAGVIGFVITLILTDVIPIGRRTYVVPPVPLDQSGVQYNYDPQTGMSVAQPWRLCKLCGYFSSPEARYCAKCGKPL